MRPHLFVDSDGVFADFDKNCFNCFGRYPSGWNDADMWRTINEHPSFWEDMPLMPGAEEFWNAIKHVNPTVLTGCPKTDYERAEAAKHAWWREKFNHTSVITCLSRDKAKHIQAEGDWLIDDMRKNCKRWADAKGVAVRYTGDWESVVRLLSEKGVI